MEKVKDDLADAVKKLNSADAASYLIEKLPIHHVDYWRAFDIIKSRSWGRREQQKLLRYYMQKAPFANGSPYSVFLRMMSFSRFLDEMAQALPIGKDDLQLFLYHLAPLIRAAARTSNDLERAEQFISGARNNNADT